MVHSSGGPAHADDDRRRRRLRGSNFVVKHGVALPKVAFIKGTCVMSCTKAAVASLFFVSFEQRSFINGNVAF